MSSSVERVNRRKSPDEDQIESRNSQGAIAFALNILTAPLRPIRPYLPHLFPLIVCLLCIPILVFLSGAAGWIVWRNVPVGWRADAYLQYGDAINPFAVTEISPLLADQPYDISLHLVLPATESNFALGNFMATLKLTTAYNESLVTVRRSATLVPPQPSLLKQLLLGSSPTIKIDMPLLYSFISGTSTVHARLELGRSDGWKGIGNGHGRELSVLEATLKGSVRPRGIHAILARFPRLTTFVSTFIFFFISLMIVSAFLFTTVRPDPSSEQPPSPRDSGGSHSGSEHDGDVCLSARRLSKRRSFKRDSESGSSGWEDEKEDPNFKSGVQLTRLRKRRSGAASEGPNTNKPSSQIKIETGDTISSHRGNSPVYPKSPFPRPSSTGSRSSSQRQSATSSPASPINDLPLNDTDKEFQ